MSMQIPHYQEHARRASARKQASPDEVVQRMRISQAEMRAASQRPCHHQLVTATRAVDGIELGLEEVADPSPTWYARP